MSTKLSIVLVVILSAFALVSCRDNSGPETRTDISNFMTFFQSISAKYNPLGEEIIQESCTPQILQPTDAMHTRGTVIMLHGFTACNQQFLDWAEQLMQEGYYVVLPLLPAHGIDFGTKYTDKEGSLLAKESEIYEEFARDMVELAENAPGPDKIIVGLSVGGAIATKATLIGDGLFDKSIILSPFLAIPGTYSSNTNDEELLLTLNEELSVLESALLGLADVSALDMSTIWQTIEAGMLSVVGKIGRDAVKVLRAAAVVPTIDVGWGDACELERNSGRAGYCNFEVQHIFAVDQFGERTLLALESITSLNTRIQIIGVENDGGADSLAVKELANLMNTRTPQSSFCLYPEGIVPHSFISKYDNIDLVGDVHEGEDVHELALQEMRERWLATFESEIMSFITSEDADYFEAIDGTCIL